MCLRRTTGRRPISFRDGCAHTCQRPAEPLVLCASVDETLQVSGGVMYSNCATVPRLVFNPTTGGMSSASSTPLMATLSSSGGVGQPTGCVIDTSEFNDFAMTPVSFATDAVIGFNNPGDAGFKLWPRLDVRDAGLQLRVLRDLVMVFLPGPHGDLDQTFLLAGQPAVAGDPYSETLGVLALDDVGLDAITWQLDAGIFGAVGDLPGPFTVESRASPARVPAASATSR